MARRGLIQAGRAADGRSMGYGIMPFVVGIYEMQAPTIDAELARLFEDYYRQTFGRALTADAAGAPGDPGGSHRARGHGGASLRERGGDRGGQPGLGRGGLHLPQAKGAHRRAVRPSAGRLHDAEPRAGRVRSPPEIRSLTQEEAMATLRRAAEAGLVHSVSNSQEGLWYICNCCTCSCGILRGLAELGMANVVARSAFVNQVDEDACIACGACVEQCAFAALTLDDVVRVDAVRCVGCGVCVPVCPENALALVRRPEEEVLPPPVTDADWRAARAAARGVDMEKVL